MKNSYSQKDKLLMYNKVMSSLSTRFRNQLNESQESKSFDAAKKYLVQRMRDWDAQRVDKFLRIRMRETFPELRTKAGGKFMYGVVRLWFDSEIEYEGDFSDMNTILQIISSPKYIDEYDRNFNGLSFKELKNRFIKLATENYYNDRRQLYSEEFEGLTDYKVIRIPDFETAKKYAKYSNPDDVWCIAKNEEHFNNYTCDGLYTVYFCFREGFKDIKNRPGDTAPLDKYGLSMFCVIVNDRGWLSHCTLRWNHKEGGNDHAMTTKQISELINHNFYEIFKPVAPVDEKGNPVVTPRNAQKFLDNGSSPDEIFDEIIPVNDRQSIVRLKNKQSILYRNKKLFEDGDVWFNSVRQSGYDYFMYGIKQNIVLIIDDTNTTVDYSQFNKLQRFRNQRFLKLELDKQFKLFDTEFCEVCNPNNYFDEIKWLTGDYFVCYKGNGMTLFNPVKKVDMKIDFKFTGRISPTKFEVERDNEDYIFDLDSLEITPFEYAVQ